MNFPSLIKRIYGVLLEFISPLNCIVCENYIGKNKSRISHLCLSCFDKIPFASEPEIIYNNLISNFSGDELSISGAFSLMSLKEDSDYMELIYYLKYHGLSHLGIEMGRELGYTLEYYKSTDYDYIIPIPIHHARRRERGYNQSEEIAKGISQILNLPTNFDAIRRIKYTQTQTKLNKAERMRNVANVFAPKKNCKSVSGRKILLVDDVLTTGSTLNSCGNILLEMGAKRVDAATLLFAN